MMKRYIVHLKTEYHDKKKTSANAILAKKTGETAAKTAFALAIRPLAKSKELLLVGKEYLGQTYSVAVLVDIAEDRLDHYLNALRKIDVVDVIELE